MNIEYNKVGHDLLTNKHTSLYYLEGHPSGVPHQFLVVESDGIHEGEFNTLQVVNFQDGPIKEAGVNGVHHEDLIHMIVCRLQCFQNGPYSCRDNAMAITKLEEALMWLRKRTVGREARGVEGTSEV